MFSLKIRIALLYLTTFFKYENVAFKKQVFA